MVIFVSFFINDNTNMWKVKSDEENDDDEDMYVG